MPQLVDIPTVGRVEFPDGMTDEEMAQAIQENYPQLNNMYQGGSGGNEPSTLSSILQVIKDVPDSLGAFTRGIGTSVVNFSNNLANMALPKNFQFQKLPQEEGGSFKTGELAGDVGTFLLGGEALKPMLGAAESIPYLNKLASSLSGEGLNGIARRALGSGAYGAVQNPDNKAMGALAGAGLSLGGEAIPGSLKALTQLSEKINPIGFTKNLAKSISENYQNAKAEAGSYFNPVSEKFGKSQIFEAGVPSNYKSLDKDLFKNYYDYGLNKMHQDFLDNPTFQKAHDLQSQLGIEMRSMQKGNPDAYTRKTVSALSEARNSLKDDMLNYLGSKDPESAAMYNKGAQIFADKVIPYRSNPTINKIAEGTQKTITPAQLEKQLTNIVESGKADQSHFLGQALGDISNKINQGKVWGAIPMVVGGALGSLVGAEHGIPAGIATTGAGAAVGKILNPTLMKLAQNPAAISGVSKFSNSYDLLRKAIISGLLSTGAQ